MPCETRSLATLPPTNKFVLLISQVVCNQLPIQTSSLSLSLCLTALKTSIKLPCCCFISSLIQSFIHSFSQSVTLAIVAYNLGSSMQFWISLSALFSLLIPSRCSLAQTSTSIT